MPIFGVTLPQIVNALGFTPANPASLGTAAGLNAGTAAGNLIRLDPTTGKLPAVDGSLLVNLPGGAGTGTVNPTGGSYVDGHVVLFSGTTGQLIRDGGYVPANQSDTTDLLNSTAYMALLLGGLKGALVGLTDGFDDNYVDETGIDTGNSSNITWASGGVANGTPAVILPAMTSDTAPSPWTASATTEIGGGAAWKAFDGSGSTYWGATAAPSVGAPQNLTLAKTTAFTVSSYAITNTSVSNSPTAWTLQGYNGSTWVTLDTQASISWASSPQTNSFYVASPGSYTQYRLAVTAIQSGSSLSIVELVFSHFTPVAMTLQSLAPVALKSAPSRVGIYVLATVGGVLNTDLIVSVSRDGATFTAGTLVAIATLVGKTLYELQGSDGLPGVIVTGQPSGTIPKYKIVTTATYAQTVYGETLRAA